MTAIRTDGRSILLAALLFPLAGLALAVAEPQLRHWFVIPVVLSGMLVGLDAIDWLRGRMDVFDPWGVVGLLGVHFFFLAPMLHVLWDNWMAYVYPLDDWREWLGRMAVLNVIGLVFYRASREWSAGTSWPAGTRVCWVFSRRRFPIVIGLAALVAALLQVDVYRSFGGIRGYMESYIEGEKLGGDSPFRGMGVLFMISESFPILALIAYTTWLRLQRVPASWWRLCLVLLAYFVLQILFGGLRGSRSNTIWSLFWAVGAIHFWVRPVPRRMIYAGFLFLLVFLNVYAFYKHAGLDALDSFAAAREQQKMGQQLTSTLLGDLGRSDVQAFVLHHVSQPAFHGRFTAGRTYLGAAALLIPRFLWPGRPPTKEVWTSELEYGEGSYEAGVWRSARVYGMAGEAMLNFGPLAVPFAFGLWGLLVGKIRHWTFALPEGDSRILLTPLLIMFCFIALIGDSDNAIFFLMKYGTFPLVVIAVSSRRLRAV